VGKDGIEQRAVYSTIQGERREGLGRKEALWELSDGQAAEEKRQDAL
jgi:hypothetical protein